MEVFVCETCGDGRGWLWPTSSDDNSDHQWVERCDACDRFDTDEAACDFLVKRIRAMEGMDNLVRGSAYIPSIGRNAPYIDCIDGDPIIKVVMLP
jgi:hypothetical protein